MAVNMSVIWLLRLQCKCTKNRQEREEIIAEVWSLVGTAVEREREGEDGVLIFVTTDHFYTPTVHNIQLLYNINDLTGTGI